MKIRRGGVRAVFNPERLFFLERAGKFCLEFRLGDYLKGARADDLDLFRDGFWIHSISRPIKGLMAAYSSSKLLEGQTWRRLSLGIKFHNNNNYYEFKY